MGAAPVGSDPVERRDILLRRARFALRASLARVSLGDTVKLLVRAADEAATNARQASFLVENADLVASLAGPNLVRDFVFRRRGGHEVRWTLLSHCAAMLSGDEHHVPEARSYLRAARDWLREWGCLSDEERREQRVDDRDIAAIGLANLRLEGVRAGARFIAGWHPAAVPFRAGRLVARRLLDEGRRGEAGALAGVAAVMGSAGLALAVACEFGRIAVPLPANACERLVEVVRRASPLPDDWGSERDRLRLSEGVIALAETAAHYGLPADRLLDSLAQHAPSTAAYVLRHWDSTDHRDLLLRHAALCAVLGGRAAAPEDVAPERIKEDLARLGPDQGNDDVRAFRSIYLPLLAWHELRAKIIAGQVAADDAPAACRELTGRRVGHLGYWVTAADRSDAATHAGRLLLDCRLWSQSADASLASEIEAWLDHEDVVISASAWTDLARRCAHQRAVHPAAVRFASHAARLLEVQHADAIQTAQSHVMLARAVLPVSLDEARSYFETALERLDRIGDELHAKLFCLLTVTNRAAVAKVPHPKEAYRVARTAELLSEYDSHKFPWLDVADTVAGLCPASALAIASRWRDRDRCRLDSTLPWVMLRLVRDGVLDGGTAAALHAFGGYWKLRRNADLLLAREPDQERRRQALSMLAMDMEFDAGDDMAAAECHGLDHPRLRRLAAFQREEHSADGASYVPDTLDYDDPRASNPEWPAIFGAEDFTTSSGINAAAARMRESNAPFRWDVLFERMRQAVPVAGWAAHVATLAKASEFSTSLVLDAVEAAAAAWNDSVAVRRAVGRAVLDLPREAPLEFARSRWGLQRELPKVAVLSGSSSRKIFDTLAKSVADHVEGVDADGLLGLAEVAVELLDPPEALDTLAFTLDRLEPLLRETDGDGSWRSELASPDEPAAALAGLLYATLAAPQPGLRWRAAHAVRRLCRLGCWEVIAAICDMFYVERLPAFTDADLPFYALHARLYALIALARSAGESPVILRPHVGTFVRLALEDLPHVLIRRFAAEAALGIEKVYPGTIAAEVADRLRRVNASPHPRAEPARTKVGGWDNLRSVETRFSFGYDIDRYWFGPLAEVFNLTSSEIALRADIWISNRWGNRSRGWWKRDPRGHRGHYRDLTVLASHGEYPRVDSLSFYLEYHAMHCVAGDLLAELPAVEPTEWGDDRWTDWLSGHDLTRRDGLWLADRRDLPHWRGGGGNTRKVGPTTATGVGRCCRRTPTTRSGLVTPHRNG